jgi:hypothetical protein
MKKLLIAGMLSGLMGSAANTLHAEQLDCTSWNTKLIGSQGVTGKATYLLGYLDGIVAMAVAGKTKNPSEFDAAVESVSKVWSAKVTVEQLIALLDSHCARAENAKLPIPAAISQVAR